MAEIQNMAKFLNPLTLHLQKLDLEFKCPLCLNLLNKPMLLPCNHIVCDLCVPLPFQNKSECPTCKNQFSVQDIRPAPYMENLVTIYRSLHSTFTSVTSRHLSAEQTPASLAPAHIEKLKGEPSQVLGDEARNSTDLCLVKTNVDRQTSLSPHPSYGCKGNNGGLETQEEGMHQAPELSPESSPSSTDCKDRNCNGSAPDSRCGGIEKCKAEMPVGDLLETTCYARDAKRQKMLDYSSPEAGVSNDVTQEQVCYSDNTATSNCKLEEHLYVAQPTISHKKGVCALCHASKQTDGTGPLLYYANGREVDGEVTTISTVIPVHRKCIEWTPRVYYERETIKNLESELGRSAKLKCASCGQKGAALGCFEKSCRRTYHVPCAFEIQECRWDCEDFLMLCPNHKSVKFPREKKSKLRKSASEFKDPMSTEMTLSNEFWATSPNGPKEWVFCGSALSSEEKFILVKFATMCGATVSKFWRPNVTHVIAATDEKGACTRTLKVLMGILNGRWILNMDWIRSCMKANHPLDEEPYEINLDNHGCLNGPKTGRLRVLNKEPKLFEGINFYFTGDFVPAYKFDLYDLVRTAGGALIESMEQLMTLSHDVQATSTCLVVYNGDPPQGCSTGTESSIVSQRVAEARNLANQTNSSVVAHKWILDSIAACLC